MRKYEVIFFDWDGTAVLSRAQPANEVIGAMFPLLMKGVKLAVISGTSYMNIAGGKLAESFPPPLRANLYLGLGRGANNYNYDEKGDVVAMDGILPDKRTLSALHRTCFQLHEHMFEQYGYNTDIVFSRDNYCKIDLEPGIKRGDRLYFSGGELDLLNARLRKHGYFSGIKGLFDLAVFIGEQNELAVKPTTDAKFLEIGLGTKSDNVDVIMEHLEGERGVDAADCCFWGDEYLEMGKGIFGSDAFMITDKTFNCDFFDVSDAQGKRPRQVKKLGGGVNRFLSFLQEQSELA
ncbi:MAG: HAD family hydrolase [Oscillospiraceae bacterium]|jgi:hypothetical protein|nr:HAD family hydrolase [Oscillospiraceae bacterium]